MTYSRESLHLKIEFALINQSLGRGQRHHDVPGAHYHTLRQPLRALRRVGLQPPPRGRRHRLQINAHEGK